MRPTSLRLRARPGSIDIVDGSVQPILNRLRDSTGVLNLFVSTPGCALSVNENCDASVRSDMLAALERLVPGTSEEAAETKALLYGKSLSLPVGGGSLRFGTWQGIYLCAFGAQAVEAEVTATFVAAADRPGAFTFSANRRSSHPLDEQVLRSMPPKAADGVVLVHELHTSASVAVSAEGGDLEPGMSTIIPETWNREFFTHTMEGDDDMPGHLKSSLLGCSVALPLEAGSLLLGANQQLLLNEHRNAGGWGGGHSRKVCCTAVPVAAPPKSISCPAAASVGAGSPAAPIREVTKELLEAMSAQDGLLTVFAQDPSVGVAACTRSAAEALVVSAVLGVDALCGPAIVGCSLVLPVAAGRLLLPQGHGVFLLGANECDVVVATSASGGGAAV